MLAVRPPKEEPVFSLFHKVHGHPSSLSPVKQDVLAAHRLAVEKVAKDSRPITAMRQHPAAAGNVTCAERARRQDIEQEPGDEFRQTGIIKVRTQTGVDQDRYSVLALRSPIVSPSDNLQEFKNRVNLDGVKAVDPAKCERFAILLDPLKAGGIGRGIVAGVVPVRVNVIGRVSPSFSCRELGRRRHRPSQTAG
jgi:hypothetical protein